MFILCRVSIESSFLFHSQGYGERHSAIYMGLLLGLELFCLEDEGIVQSETMPIESEAADQVAGERVLIHPVTVLKRVPVQKNIMEHGLSFKSYVEVESPGGDWIIHGYWHFTLTVGFEHVRAVRMRKVPSQPDLGAGSGICLHVPETASQTGVYIDAETRVSARWGGSPSPLNVEVDDGFIPKLVMPSLGIR